MIELSRRSHQHMQQLYGNCRASNQCQQATGAGGEEGGDVHYRRNGITILPQSKLAPANSRGRGAVVTEFVCVSVHQQQQLSGRCCLWSSPVNIFHWRQNGTTLSHLVCECVRFSHKTVITQHRYQRRHLAQVLPLSCSPAADAASASKHWPSSREHWTGERNHQRYSRID